MKMANSADSHVLEPQGLWLENLPASMRDRALYTVKDDTHETVFAGGKAMWKSGLTYLDRVRPPGAHDPEARLLDLDDQGVWGEVLFPSVALWTYYIDDLELQVECGKLYNDWLLDTFMRRSPRWVGVAFLPTVEIASAVAELQRAVSLGYRAVMLPSTAPPNRPYSSAEWDPLWAAAQEAGTPVCFHVGTGQGEIIIARGAGGAVINYVETFYPTQRTLCHLVASGALDRHPDLHVVFVEGGASWLPSLMERMDEGYQQHAMFVRPKLSMLPSEFIARQAHATFQHDRAALQTLEITGTQAILWGSDYPHLEGTWPNTQETLEGIFKGTTPEVRAAVTYQNLADLFGLPDAEQAARPA